MTAHFAGTVCILLAAEIYPLLARRPELYIMARIYTLAAHLLVRACWDIFPDIMPISVFNAEFNHWWGVFNSAIAVAYVFWFTWQLNTGKASVSFRRGTARQAYIDSHPEEMRRLEEDRDLLNA